MGEVFAGRYELVDLLGQGGMGAVWRVWDRRERGYLAAKVLKQSDAASLIRFVREQALRIHHPYVVAPRGWVAEDDRVLFTMDIVGGGSLATLLGDHGPLPASFVACLADELLDGLTAVHATGVVHRDVKPANLLLEPTGTGRPVLRLSDFGIAVRTDEPRLTHTGMVVGTPGYVAPELVAGAAPDPLQDLYAVGILCAELLTGTRPTGPALPATPPDRVPAAFWRLVRDLARPVPDERPASAAAARKLLAATGSLPASGSSTPWADGPDGVEVFSQLPPLPAGWTPAGPAASDPTASGLPHAGEASPRSAAEVPTVPDGAERVTVAGAEAAPTRVLPDRPEGPDRSGVRDRRGVPGRVAAAVAAVLAVVGLTIGGWLLLGDEDGSTPDDDPSKPTSTPSNGGTPNPSSGGTTAPDDPPSSPGVVMPTYDIS